MTQDEPRCTSQQHSAQQVPIRISHYDHVAVLPCDEPYQSLADVFALAEELQRRGLALASGPEVEGDGSDGATLRDPDGVLVYLNTAPGEGQAEPGGRSDEGEGS